MKKSLIALAVLAASGASFAQSSVTLYGTVDEALAHVTTTGTPSQNLMVSGGVSTTNFGFKGAEDLGGGLKAIFKLEQGFNVATGAAGTPGAAFNRYAYVGFSGGFGEVQLGKNGTPYDDIQNATDSAFASNALSPIGGVVGSGAFRSSLNYNWNPANTIKYVAPSVAGFNGAISYSLGENKTATADAGSIISLNATYATGPVFVGFAYQAEKADGNAETIKFTRLNASYDLKVVTLLGTYGNVKNLGFVPVVPATTPVTYSTVGLAGAATNEWSLGVNVPVSSALTVSAGYARSTDDAINAIVETKRTAYSLAAAYSLSKRTTLYTGYTSGTSTPNGAADTTITVLAAGVKHTF